MGKRPDTKIPENGEENGKRAQARNGPKMAAEWKNRTQIMAEKFNLLWPEIQNYFAEADADLIPVTGQFELHGRCRCGVLLSPCFGFVGMEELELHCRCRDRLNSCSFAAGHTYFKKKVF